MAPDEEERRTMLILSKQSMMDELGTRIDDDEVEALSACLSIVDSYYVPGGIGFTHPSNKGFARKFGPTTTFSTFLSNTNL